MIIHVLITKIETKSKYNIASLIVRKYSGIYLKNTEIEVMKKIILKYR